MVEDNDLFAHSEDAFKVIEDYFIHDVISTLCVAHLLDTVEGALERRWPVARVEAERAGSIGVDEVGDVQVVG